MRLQLLFEAAMGFSLLIIFPVHPFATITSYFQKIHLHSQQDNSEEHYLLGYKHLY
jgi:hypothetical protein